MIWKSWTLGDEEDGVNSVTVEDVGPGCIGIFTHRKEDRNMDPERLTVLSPTGARMLATVLDMWADDIEKEGV